MAALTGKVARIRITAATPSSSTDNAATMSTNGQTVTIDSTALRHWAADPTVAIGGTATTDTFVTNRVSGIVTFTTPHSTASAYTLDVAALSGSYVGEGRNWSASVAVDMRDHTAFSTTTADVQWRTVAPGLNGGTVSIERFWGATTGPAFFDRIAAGQNTVIELWTDYATRHKLEGFAYVDGDGFTVPVDGDAGESVTLTIDGELYLSTA